MKRKGIGNVIATMIFVLILFSTITGIYLYYVKKQGDLQQAYFDALERKVQAEEEKISASFTFGNSTGYRPSSYTLLKGSSTDPVDRLYERDSSYLNVSSSTDVDYDYPVENMNFTGGIDGWRETYRSFIPPPFELYIDYSPDNGYLESGSLLVGFSQERPTESLRLVISTFFTLSSPPSSTLDSYLSWASYVSQIDEYTIEIRMVLKNPNGVNYDMDYRVVSSPDGNWVFNSVVLSPPSEFWVEGTYTLSILFESKSYHPGRINTIKAYLDDIGLKLAKRTVRVTDYYATFSLDMSNVDRLLIHHIGHCTATPCRLVTQTFYLYDFSTGSWVQVGWFNSSSMDSSVNVEVSNASRYVSSGEARVRIESKVYADGMYYCGDYLNLEAVDSSSDSGLSTLTIKITNQGPIPVHLVSLWVINSSSPEHYDTNLVGEHKVDLVVPPNETEEIKLTYHWGSDTYLIKLVSERGNVWSYSVSNL